MLPILVFAGSLICLGNLLGLGLFILAYRRQSARQHNLLHRTRDDFQGAINQILDRFHELRAQTAIDDATPEFETVTSPQASPMHLAGPGLTFSKRAQILRLHRQGENTQQIAAAIGLPRAEVDLIVKLHAPATHSPV